MAYAEGFVINHDSNYATQVNIQLAKGNSLMS